MGTKYIRRGRIISSVEKDDQGYSKEIIPFDSFNNAKKASREMQNSNGPWLRLFTGRLIGRSICT